VRSEIKNINMNFVIIKMKLFLRFVIDFVATPALNVQQDIMFHMSCRMDERVIVRNAFVNKKWLAEERYGAFRMKYNETFELIILQELEHYKIAVNGVHLGVFRHRLPLNLVNYISVHGDVTIDHILLDQDIKSASQYAALVNLINPGASQINYMPIQPHIPMQRPQQHIPIQQQQPHQHFPIQQQPPFPIQQQPPYPINQQTMAIGSCPTGLPNYDGQQAVGYSAATMPSAPPIQSSYEPPPSYNSVSESTSSTNATQNSTWVFRKY
jgi:hypothetical protein